jgi:hypothetical protein
MNPSKLLVLLPVFLFLLSCGSSQKDSYESSAEASADTTAVAGYAGEDAKLVKTAAIRTKVKDVERSAKEVAELTGKFRGMVFHQQLTAEQGQRRELKVSDDSLLVISTYTPTAEMTVRVPSEELQPFLYGVASLGYLTESSTLDIEDKSLRFLENRLRQSNRLQTINAMPAAAKDKGGNLTALDLKDQVTDQKIENLAIDKDVQYSSVTISLFQNGMVKKETIPNYNISAYHLPFWSRLSGSLAAGLDFFLSFVVAIANLWAFVVVAVMAFMSYRWFYKRKAVSASINGGIGRTS